MRVFLSKTEAAALRKAANEILAGGLYSQKGGWTAELADALKSGQEKLKTAQELTP